MVESEPPASDSAAGGAPPIGPSGGGFRASIVPCVSMALRQTLRIAVLAVVAAALAAVAAVVTYRTVDPPGSMLMWSHSQDGRPVVQRWVPIDRISPALVRAVIMSEDNQFCRHWGIDVGELSAIVKRVERTGEDPTRGASTISMQLTKNLLLWPDKSYVRKAFELPLTVLVELLWPKRRIMEVYLNIVEWGPGVFGAEAAAQHHFRKAASRLSENEATLLAVALPNPITRVAGKPSAHLQRVAGVIERRVKSMGRRADCVLGDAGRQVVVVHPTVDPRTARPPIAAAN